MQEQQSIKRNFWPMVLEGSLFLGGMKFFGTETVTPMFVKAMGGNEALLGLIITLTSLIPSILDLIVGPYASYIKNQAKYCTIMMSVTRPLPLFIMPLILFLDLPPAVVLVAYTISFIGLRLGNGFVVTAWQDLFARVMNERDRDRVYDYQLFFGGAFGVLCGFLVSFLMKADGMGQNTMYAILFGLGGLFSGLSAICMGIVQDRPRECKELPDNRLLVLKKYYSGIFQYWKNKEFRKLYFCELLRYIGSGVFPFVILMGGEVFGLTEGQLSTVVIANVVGGILSGITWHFVSDRFGSKGVILGSQIMQAVIPVLLVISLINGNVAFIMILIIQCIMGHVSNDWVGYSNYLLLIIDEKERPEYMVFRALIKLPFSFISMLAGAAAAVFGYWPLAVVTLVVSVAGAVSVAFFKK